MARDKKIPNETPAENTSSQQSADNPYEDLRALEGVEYVSVSEDGVMDDDLFALLSEEEQPAQALDNPFENLRAVEGAVSILGRHDGLMDDDMLDITIERSGWDQGQRG